MKNKYWLWYGDLSVLLRSESHLVTKSHSSFFKSHWIEKWEITACYCVTGSVQRDRTWSFKEGLAQLTSWAPIECYSTDTAGSKAIKSLLSNFTSNFYICPSCNKQWIPQFTRISHIIYQPTLIIQANNMGWLVNRISVNCGAARLHFSVADTEELSRTTPLTMALCLQLHCWQHDFSQSTKWHTALRSVCCIHWFLMKRLIPMLDHTEQ